jgi:hypothetical protein
VQSVTVTSESVVCRLDFGSPPYIPAGALNELLPACARLADLLEPDGAGEPSEPARRSETADESEPSEPSVGRDARDLAE